MIRFLLVKQHLNNSIFPYMINELGVHQILKVVPWPLSSQDE